MYTKKIILYIVSLVIISLCACIGESEQVIREKLDLILSDDLEAIIEDIDTAALLEEPYYDLVDYREYNEGSFSRMAIADFYFFRTLNLKITRKYRYIKSMGLWDRYYNKYYTITPEAQGTSEASQTSETNETEK